MKILLINSDAILIATLTVLFDKEGFLVESCMTAEEGIEFLLSQEFDICVFDINSKDISFSDFLNEATTLSITPIICISDSGHNIQERIKAFAFNASDFMSKPFNEEELIARCKAVVRRNNGHSQNKIHSGNVNFDLDDRLLRVGRKVVKTTEKEKTIVEMLFLRKGRAVSKDSIMETLYSLEEEPVFKIVDVFICKIRKNIREYGGDPVILTEWGVGYSVK